MITIYEPSRHSWKTFCTGWDCQVPSFIMICHSCCRHESSHILSCFTPTMKVVCVCSLCSKQTYWKDGHQLPGRKVGYTARNQHEKNDAEHRPLTSQNLPRHQTGPSNSESDDDSSDSHQSYSVSDSFSLSLIISTWRLNTNSLLQIPKLRQRKLSSFVCSLYLGFTCMVG